MSEEDDLPQRKKLIIFGTNVAEIPCFRSTFLYGISGGLTGGLAFFLFTSKVRLATHFGYGSFVLTSICCWVHCRYKYSQEKFSVSQIQKAYKEYMIREGSEGSLEVKDA